MIMIAFHNDPAIKARCIARIQAHRRVGNLIQRCGWKNGRGSPVGCTLDALDYVRYQAEFGIPEVLARLEDVIFDGLPARAAMSWPDQFLKAVPVGGDLSRVGWQILHWLLTDIPIQACLSDDSGFTDKMTGVEGADEVVDMEGEAAIVADIIEPLTRGEPANLDDIESYLPITAPLHAVKELEDELLEAEGALTDAKEAISAAWAEREEAETEADIAAEAAWDVEDLKRVLEVARAEEDAWNYSGKRISVIVGTAHEVLIAWTAEVTAGCEMELVTAKSEVARKMAESVKRSVEALDFNWVEVANKLLELVGRQAVPQDKQVLALSPDPFGLSDLDLETPF